VRQPGAWVARRLPSAAAMQVFLTFDWGVD
jgi:hypothetical protein